MTPELREKVVTLKQTGMNSSNTSREVDRSKSVISRILKLYADKKTLVSASKPGRPRKTTQRDDRVIKRYVGKDPFATAAGILKKNKTDLDKVHFSNESKFNLVGLYVRQCVCRRAEDRLNPKCVKMSVKVRGGLLKVGKCFILREFFELMIIKADNLN